MNLFVAALAAATLLCSLVAGFLFAFAVVAMPGIGRLNDRDFLRAFQAMDRVIQNNHPVFVLVWMGSVVALIGALVLGFGRLEGADLLLLVAAGFVYIVGVQLPTITINIPLNNTLQSFDVAELDAVACKEARNNFESRWNRSNVIRTFLSGLTAAMLIVLLVRL